MLIKVVDSHTEGEPTRVILNGPDLTGRSMERRARVLREDFTYAIRSALGARSTGCNVAAFLGDPVNEDSEASVVFANRAEILGMCVHGTIGVVRTLQYLGRVGSGPDTRIRLDTPAGQVTATTKTTGEIAVENVVSRRVARGIEVRLEDRTVHCDIAWGGNWFALSDDHGEKITLENHEGLRGLSKQIRSRINEDGVPGFEQIDHVALFGPGSFGCGDRNFVLCPDDEFDRSPCGTATSARIACLAADKSIEAHHPWIQESITGSSFEASWRKADAPDCVIPTIAGRAWITGEFTIDLDQQARSVVETDTAFPSKGKRVVQET